MSYRKSVFELSNEEWQAWLRHDIWEVQSNEASVFSENTPYAIGKAMLLAKRTFKHHNPHNIISWVFKCVYAVSQFADVNEAWQYMDHHSFAKCHGEKYYVPDFSVNKDDADIEGARAFDNETEAFLTKLFVMKQRGLIPDHYKGYPCGGLYCIFAFPDEP